MGKPVMDAYNIDVPGAAGVFRWYAESLDKLYDQVAPSAQNVLATITREALGVVAAVVLELSAGYGRVETRASPGGGQLGNPQAGRAIAVFRAASGRAGAGSRTAGRCAQRVAGAWRTDR